MNFRLDLALDLRVASYRSIRECDDCCLDYGEDVFGGAEADDGFGERGGGEFVVRKIHIDDLLRKLYLF